MGFGDEGGAPLKEVVVLSGKGGTGKTTLIAGFSALSPEAVLVDCDVDAPNLHLLVSGSLIEEGGFSASQAASLDASRCDRCRICAESCRFEAVLLDDAAGPRIDGIACEGCGLCERLCPSEAITMVDRASGTWMATRTSGGMMFHAILGAGEGNSGKLVAMLKRKARAYCVETSASLLLIDGPPGIGCPVIAALSGADLAVLVAEPTLAGKADLERAMSLCRQMKVVPAVAINRWDLHPALSEAIEEMARQEGAVLLGRVPFDEAVYRLASSRESIATTETAAGTATRRVWERVQELIRNESR